MLYSLVPEVGKKRSVYVPPYLLIAEISVYEAHTLCLSLMLKLPLPLALPLTLLNQVFQACRGSLEEGTNPSSLSVPRVMVPSLLLVHSMS